MWEEERLAVLRSARILDSPPDEAFDALTRLAALTCETPLSFVTLIDANRLWFKSKFGSELAEMPREQALCGHTAEQGRPFFVHDILADSRFSENPLYREGGLRAYAGHPVFTREGICIGTLCCLDTKPRDFTGDQQQALGLLAGQVGALIELHRARIESESQAARRHDEQLRLILDSIPDGVIVTVDNIVVYRNPATMQLIRRTPEEVAHGNPFAYLHPEDQPRARARMLEMAQGGSEFPSEYRFLLPDGSVAAVEIRSRLIRFDGRPAVLSVIQDLSERRRVEAERREIEGKLQQAQKLESLGILAGGIAHDFNNLLTSILGNLSLARRDLPPDTSCLHRIDSTEKAAMRAADLCRQMLAYSGRGKFMLRPVDLSAVVREMGELLSVSISKRAKLRYELDETLPPVHADATQITQIVMNLITNASEALNGRDGTIVIRTGHREYRGEELESPWIPTGVPSGDYAYVEVEDDGCGMDEETRRRLFDPFYTTKFTGRGLGMAAVLGIVRGHRGAIRLRSEPRRGTSMTILFPCALQAAVPAEEPAKSPSAEIEVKGTILVVDDEDIVRDLAREILESAGFVVHTHADGAAAVQWMKMARARIDAALVDLTMPRMGGEETCRELRHLTPGLPVILTSGFNEQELQDPDDLGGPVAFLHKPYPPAELVRLVRTCLSGDDRRAA